MTDDAFFISFGKRFHIRQPEYLRLCLKYSVLGLGHVHLAIERGKYKNIKSGDRICKYCHNNETEDEVHFLINCPKYSLVRTKLFSYIENLCKNIKVLTNENKFIWLMTNEITGIITKLSSHIFTCFEIRKQHSSN